METRGALTRQAALALLLGVAGCSDWRYVGARPLNPPQESNRQNLTALTVRPGYEPDARVIDEPWRKSRSVGKGALKGAALPIYVGGTISYASGGTDYGVFTMLGVLLAPVGAVAGAVAGPIMAMPDQEVEGYRSAILDSFARVDPAPPIARSFVERARSVARLPASVEDRPSDSVQLELTVIAYGLRHYGGDVNPPMQTFVVLRGRLRDGSDGKILHELLWMDGGRSRRFKEWAEANPNEIWSEFERIQSNLAEAAEEEMLELVLIP